MGIISHVNKLWWMGAIGHQWDPVKVVTIDKEVVVKEVASSGEVVVEEGPSKNFKS